MFRPLAQKPKLYQPPPSGTTYRWRTHVCKCEKCGEHLPHLDGCYSPKYCEDCGSDMEAHRRYFSVRKRDVSGCRVTSSPGTADAEYHGFGLMWSNNARQYAALDAMRAELERSA